MTTSKKNQSGQDESSKPSVPVAFGTSSNVPPSAPGQVGSPKPPEPEKLNLYDLFIGLLTALSLTLMALLFVTPDDAPTYEVFFAMDNLFCAIFMADFIGRLIRAKPRRKYFFWQGVTDFLGSIPAIPALRLFRIFRLFRLIRLLRIGGPKRIVSEFVERRSESVLYITVTLALILLTVGSVLVLAYESRSPDGNIKSGGDAIWYSIVTITTVGYGDRFPVTLGGRVVGVVTMMFGIGIFGVITSFMANAFMSPTKKQKEAADKKAEEEHQREVAAQDAALELRTKVVTLQSELEEIKMLLKERSAADGGR